jgi:hypothetical protein
MTDQPATDPTHHDALVEQLAVIEPTFTVVLMNHDTGGRGEVRHSPVGCPADPERMAAWSNPGQREAFFHEMFGPTALTPCLTCLGMLR